MLGGHRCLGVGQVVDCGVGADEAVEQCRVVVLRLGMRIAEVRPQRPDAADERVVVLGRVFQSARFGVRLEVRALGIEFDVAYPERSHHRGARVSVGEELYHGDVARLRDRRDESAESSWVSMSSG